MSLHNNHNHKSSGFTLVELMVAIALFSILVSMAAGGFVRALRSERQVAAMMAAESNISLAMEEMTREIRTGYLFCHDPGSGQPSGACSAVYPSGITMCTSDNAPTPTWTCPNGLEFYNANGDKVDYVLTNGILERSDNSENGGALTALTSANIDVTYLTFTLFGNLETDSWNPRVTISASVEPNDNTVTWSTANLEATVSARSIDRPPS